MAKIEKPKPKLPSKFIRRPPTAAVVTDLDKLIEERDGPPLAPKQWNNPYSHAHGLKTGTTFIQIDEEHAGQRRGWQYKWTYRLNSAHLTVDVCYLFGEAWCHCGNFHFDGIPSWSTQRFLHVAKMYGFPELERLALDACDYQNCRPAW